MFLRKAEGFFLRSWNYIFGYRRSDLKMYLIYCSSIQFIYLKLIKISQIKEKH